MKKLFIKSILTTVITAALVSCGGGSNDLAGIGGSGYVSDGTVTGFGSVYVNGVKFETNSAIFEVEDNINATQTDLRIGMVVQVFGDINTSTATRIHYSDDLEGPITSINENADLTEKTLTILGTTVIVDKSDTVYENTSYSALANDNVIEVSGYYDNTNVLHASYVEFKSAVSNTSDVFEVSGIITNLGGSSFTVQGISINAEAAVLSDLPNGLQNGIDVEVKGRLNGSVIDAVEVEGNNDELSDDGSDVSIEGIITDYVDDNNFKIKGQLINATTATKLPSVLTLKNGIKVEAEGTISNGVLNATEIESRSGDSEVTAVVTSVDIDNKVLTVSVVAGQPSITVQLTSATLTEDGIDSGQLDLSNITTNTDFVEVRGFESGTRTITATRVKRLTGEKTELQGVITAKDDDISITILGIVFPVDINTEYEDEFEATIPDFFSLFPDTVILDQSIISIEDAVNVDTNPVGFADSVEIESL